MDAREDKRLALAHERLTWREVDTQVIVLDKRSWNYLSINDTGTQLWRQLAEGATRAELIARLCEHHLLDEQAAARDVDAFVSKVQEHGLLRESGDVGE